MIRISSRGVIQAEATSPHRILIELPDLCGILSGLGTKVNGDFIVISGHEETFSKKNFCVRSQVCSSKLLSLAQQARFHALFSRKEPSMSYSRRLFVVVIYTAFEREGSERYRRKQGTSHPIFRVVWDFSKARISCQS